MVSPYKVALKERLRYLKDFIIKNGNGNKVSSEKFSPLSGYEPKYEPHKWNDNERVKSTHNCYAYVQNRILNYRDKIQPGYGSNFPHINNKSYNCLEFYNRLRKDIPSLYLTTFDEKCRKGFYKGFIALDPKLEDNDYHFYRQDHNGYWSHKPGRTNVINFDASGYKIINPLKADRKYDYFNYSKPCFFFCMNSKLSSGSSRSIRNKYNI